MSAELRFYSWAQTGLSQYLEYDPSVLNSPKIPFSIKLKDMEEVTGNLNFFSHADVTNLGNDLIARIEPPHQCHNFESNYLPFIEFESYSLPWIFSPKNTGSDKLYPWVVLVVLEKDDNVTLDGEKDFKILTIKKKAGRVLPKLADSHAWVHIQETITKPDNLEPSLEKRFKELAPNFISRLICPVKLKDSKSYIACLVPSYKAGANTALGLVQDAKNLTERAWQDETDNLTLPAFYTWEFATGNEDFEALARKIKPQEARVSNSTVLNISDPGSQLSVTDLGLTSAQAISQLNFLGVLKLREQTETNWNGIHKDKFQQRLRELLELGTTAPESNDPLVSAPKYGATYFRPNAQKNWFEEINLHPVYRSIAAIGVEIAKAHQEEIISLAWSKFENGEYIKQTLTQSRLTYMTNSRLFQKMQVLPAQELTQLTSGMHGQITLDGKMSLRDELKSDPAIPKALFSKDLKKSAHSFQKKSAFKMGTSLSSSMSSAIFNGKVISTEFTKFAPSKAIKFDTGDIKKGSKELPSALYTTPTVNVRKNIEAISTKIVSQINPKFSVAEKFSKKMAGVSVSIDSQVPIPKSLGIEFNFDLPVYEWLLTSARQYFCPAVTGLAENSVTLFEVNQKFIDIFMLGFNHEVIRELTWRKFSVDPQSTPFKKFWDYIDESRVDLLPIKDWKNINGATTATTAKAISVFLFNSELFAKYPNANIYAVEAEWKTKAETESAYKSRSAKISIKPELTHYRVPKYDSAIDPILNGRFDAFSSFIGFQKDIDDLVGSIDHNQKKPGYFLVIEEASNDSHFGLDRADLKKLGQSPTTRDNLSWDHLVHDQKELEALLHIPLNPTWKDQAINNHYWGKSSADMAFLTYQKPSRILIHSSSLVQGTI
ncbi:MAG: hypothetical protein WC635_12195 [Bacteriovorax sp.]|jgi:hypothetical protein